MHSVRVFKKCLLKQSNGRMNLYQNRAFASLTDRVQEQVMSLGMDAASHAVETAKAFRELYGADEDDDDELLSGLTPAENVAFESKQRAETI